MNEAHELMRKYRLFRGFGQSKFHGRSSTLGGNSRMKDQPIKRTELIRADVADVPGKETVIYIADVVPGGEGARHTHYGDEFVYILEGSLIVTPDEKEPVTLNQGEAAHLAPADGIHFAKNGSTSEPAKVLVILVVEKGKPLAEPAK
jgi:quercetin dioxygenase-like cupin family protein